MILARLFVLVGGLLVLALTARTLRIAEFTSLATEARRRVQKLLDR